MTVLTRASLANRLLVGLITAAVAVFGLIATSSLKQELMPSMAVPAAYVMAQSDGLAPEQMVEAVTEPLEAAFKSVPGVTDVTSDTSTGSTMVTVMWPFELDADETLRALRAAGDGVKAALPAGATVEVFSGGTDQMPAVQLSASSSGDQEAFVTALQQTALPALRALTGVQQVTLAGQEEQRLVIQLRPADVERLKVDPAQITAVLRANGATFPGGEAEGEEGPLSVAVGQELGSAEDVAALPLQAEEGTRTIGEIADVSLETVPAASLSRVNGQPSLTLAVMPGSGANVVGISHDVADTLKRLAPTLGSDVEFVTLFDQAPYIEQSVHDLSVEGGLGLLFAVLVILAFLGSIRSTMIAAVSIPLSLLITMAGLWWTGNTLNMLTLGALTIAVGRVVDDSIVVIENIKRHQGDGELTPASILRSVRQVAGAITASTLTTVAVFLPIAFVSGIAGQLFRPFAITVTIALLASLVVALTIVPVLAYWFIRLPRPSRAERRAAAQAALAAPGEPGEATAAALLPEDEVGPDAPTRQLPAATAPAPAAGQAAAAEPEPALADETQAPTDRLQRAIMPALSATLRHPAITLVTSGVILIATLAMSSWIPTDFLGDSGQKSIQVSQTLAPSATLEERSEAARPVEAALGDVDGVQDVMASIPQAGGTNGAANPADFTVMLTEEADVERTTALVRRALDGLTDAGELKLSTMDTTGFGGGGIELQVLGNDRQALIDAAAQLEKHLGDAAGVESVESNLRGDQPFLRVDVDRAKAASVGYDQEQVAAAIAAALDGTPAGKITLNGAERDILLRSPAIGKGRDEVAALLLPVTPAQTAQAQKAAADTLRAEQEAKAESARIDAANELSNQIGQAQRQRGELSGQLGELRGQLAALQAAPLPPVSPLDPNQAALLRAQEERAAQLSALAEAIGQMEQGIAGADEQVSQLGQAQRDQAAQLAEAQKAEQEAEAAGKITGSPLRVDAIATVTEELTTASIRRTGGEREVTLTVTPKSGQLERASAAVDGAMAEVSLPAGVHFAVAGAGADQEESFGQLGLAMLAAIALVLLVMIATFRSFLQPLILLVSIPFAATGALLGLLITGTPLGLPAMIGLLMLIGIVVTNAIVLIDLINRLREDGSRVAEAVYHGTRLRLRPILMTAAATIFALIPMSLGLTGGGLFISKPLAIVVIGGLISSTLLTLILVPVLYTLFERGRERRALVKAGEDVSELPLTGRAARKQRRADRRAARERDAEEAERSGEEPGLGLPG